MDSNLHNKKSSEKIKRLDEELSNRFIALDPLGYFLISVDESANELVVEHYGNDIDEQGRAVDPETGEPLGCSGGSQRTPFKIYRGASAKDLGIKLTEGEGPNPLSRLDHALYLGRELQRAEECLLEGKSYIQD